MPDLIRVEMVKLTDVEDKLVNLILDDLFKRLKTVLSIDPKLINKIVIHKLVDLECV